jgi:hypothetical protein
MLSVGLSFADLPQGYALGLFYGLMGVAAVISGTWVLVRYLDEYPLPQELTDGS